MKKSWPDIPKNDILEAFREFETQAEVARFFEVPDWKIAELRKKYGIYKPTHPERGIRGKGPRKRIDKHELEKVMTKGLTRKEVAKYFDVCPETIRKRVIEYGIEVEPKKLVPVDHKHDPEPKIIESPFPNEEEVNWNKIDSERRKLFTKVEGLQSYKVERVRNCGKEIYMIFDEGFAMKMSFNSEATSDKVKVQFMTPTEIKREEEAMEKLEQANRLEQEIIRLRSEANNIRGIDNATIIEEVDE